VRRDLAFEPGQIDGMAKALFDRLTGWPFHSTKWVVTRPQRTHRCMWASSRGGSGAGGCRFFVAQRPCARR
jgi:hypothetical protein